jgi:hypothetical protein
MGYHAMPNKPDKYNSGLYKLINESKYITDPNKIVYRSSLELKFCNFIDKSDRVLKWGSEVVGIPYIGADNKQHTYWMDFYLELKNDNNPAGYDRVLVEVKPSVEVERILKNQPPTKPKKSTPTSLRNWEYALKEHAKNYYKWRAAEVYARTRNMKFIIVTEKILNQFS